MLNIKNALIPLLAAAGCASPASYEAPQPGTGSLTPEVRLYGTVQRSEGDAAGQGLAVLNYEGFSLGYERANMFEGFGVKIPAGNVFGFGRDTDLYLLQSEIDGSEKDQEAIAKIRPFQGKEADLVLRAFDSLEDGFALATNYRQHPDFDRKDNRGAGMAYTSLGDEENVGGYAWSRFPDLGGLFVGVGTYAQDNRLVVGMPNNDGEPAWRLFRVEGEGFERNELLFSTQGRNLKAVDAYSALRGNEMDPTRAFIAGGGVFRYVVPPISARGEGWTGGLVHTEAGGGESLSAELVKYLGPVFVGASYSGDLNHFGEGTVGISVGWQLPGKEDGLTRNFLRLEPFYNQETNAWGLQVVLELLK